ncbi:DNA double-strand break repair nuclease NurA [Haloarcula nitratireducens]|uniref:DNA double-strand break repair nuclease NurA n=1 Tax=Haloarcula nitratireducens TaxID=2487749 RepID=A0AAW4PBC6_9EURY|nr:DNA double-strand break repair nuclease NurA [Halomicroarcula nitratireducens]MBX0295118.1 DNA double-strand break repair nuclease NurA [Halomicroarcula nitratireducens]
MTLDPVHVDGIARLAGHVRQTVETSDQGAAAEEVWANFLDPLYQDGREILAPMGDRRRRKVPIADVALEDPPFPTQHGLDSGTINPTTFKNGLVLDVAQAAMSAVPSDVELHRGRTILMAVHSNDVTLDVGGDWTLDDRGYAKRRVLDAPKVDRYEQRVVHALALYLAESEHALTNAEVVDDLFVLDGPLYPTGLLRWAERDTELADLLAEDDRPKAVVGNYLELVERFVERDIPLVGFIKNSASKGLTRAVRGKTNAPWVNDTAFFRRILERRDDDGELRTDHLTFTNWFRSRGGTDGVMAADGDALGIERSLDPEAYEVTFFSLYDPRTDLVFRVEAPYAFTRDEDRRERLARQILHDVAAERGPPLAISKADELASIDRQGSEELTRRIEREFDTGREKDFDDTRWGAVDEAF